MEQPIIEKLDIFKNITNFENNLKNIDEKLNIIKNIGNDDFYKNLLNHNTKSLIKNSKREEIMNKYINELYKGNDKTYEFQKKIEESIKLGDLKLDVNIKEEINITNITTDYKFGNIENIKLNDSIRYLKENINEEIKRKEINNKLIHFEESKNILTSFSAKFNKKPYNSPKQVVNDDDKIDLLLYNLQKIIDNKEIINSLYESEFTKNVAKGGNKFSINIENNLFMLKENIIKVVDTYNNLSSYNQIIKIEKDLEQDIKFYKSIISYYKKIILYIDDKKDSREIFDLLTINNSLLEKHKPLNDNIKKILDKNNFQESKIYLSLTTNLELAYLHFELENS